MSERKLTIVVGIDDDAVNSIEDLEREILAQNICGQAARKYLDSLQEDMAQQAKGKSISALLQRKSRTRSDSGRLGVWSLTLAISDLRKKKRRN